MAQDPHPITEPGRDSGEAGSSGLLVFADDGAPMGNEPGR
jgi:hypothetical protein